MRLYAVEYRGRMSARRSARGKERRKQCYDDEDCDRDSELSHTRRFHLVQECAQKSRRSECREEARERAEGDEPQPLAEYLAREARRFGAECEANGELAYTTVRGVCDNAVQTDHRKQQRGGTGDSDEQHREAHVGGGIVHYRIECANTRGGHSRIQLRHDRLDSRCRGQPCPAYRVLQHHGQVLNRVAVGRKPIAIAEQWEVQHRHVTTLDAIPVHVANDPDDGECRRRRALRQSPDTTADNFSCCEETHGETLTHDDGRRAAQITGSEAPARAQRNPDTVEILGARDVLDGGDGPPIVAVVRLELHIEVRCAATREWNP